MISVPLHDEPHGAVTSNFVAELTVRGQWRGHGKVRTGTLALWRDPERTVYADAAFFSNAVLPIRSTPEGCLDTIPDLVVEVVGLNETRASQVRKVTEYLAVGVRVVWVANPSDRTIAEYRPDAEPVVHQPTDVLTVEDIIPGFRLEVAAAFVE